MTYTKRGNFQTNFPNSILNKYIIDILKDNNITKYKVYCHYCKNERLVISSFLYRVEKQKFNKIVCNNCKYIDQKTTHFKNKHGYIYRTGHSLNDIELDIARQMVGEKILDSRHGYILEHRLIMACHLNRPLTKDEVVHHKNGIKTDNRLQNLELLTTKTHNSGFGDVYYQLWQEEISKRKEIEDKYEHSRSMCRCGNPI